MISGTVLAYGLLALSIFFELIATSVSTSTKGFTVPKLTAICIAGYALSYFFFGHAIYPTEFLGVTIVPIDLGIGYATWGAVGTVVATVVGIVVYHEPVTRKGIVALVIIVISIVTLNLFGAA